MTTVWYSESQGHMQTILRGNQEKGNNTHCCIQWAQIHAYSSSLLAKI